jgi:hypothetical protein
LTILVVAVVLNVVFWAVLDGLPAIEVWLLLGGMSGRQGSVFWPIWPFLRNKGRARARFNGCPVRRTGKGYPLGRTGQMGQNGQQAPPSLCRFVILPEDHEARLAAPIRRRVDGSQSPGPDPGHADDPNLDGNFSLVGTSFARSLSEVESYCVRAQPCVCFPCCCF